MSDYDPNRPLGQQLQGLSHLALNSSDMAKTVEFYEKLGIPLVKTMEMPGGGGLHFFFDVGNGDCLAYFWWNDDGGQPYDPVAEMRDGAMNHVAFQIGPDQVQAWWDHLTALGMQFAFIDHKIDDVNVFQDLSQIDEKTFSASFYLQDPDGVQVEFAASYPAWDEHFGNSDVPKGSKRADRMGEKRSRMLQMLLSAPAPA